jgi:P pilus assembly chaperone PapD
VLNFTVTPVTGAGGAIAQNTTAYILPGQSRTWTLDKNHNEATSNTDWQRLRVKGTTEAGDFEVETRLEGG